MERNQKKRKYIRGKISDFKRGIVVNDTSYVKHQLFFAKDIIHDELEILMNLHSVPIEAQKKLDILINDIIKEKEKV